MRDAFGQPQSAIVFGGTSDIAKATVQQLVAKRLDRVVLVGRSADSLEKVKAQLQSAGCSTVQIVVSNAADPASAATAVEEAFAALGQPADLVLMAVGLLGDQQQDDDSAERTAEMFTVNTTWPAAVLAGVRGKLVTQGYGHIVVLSSVAAIRTRRANYTYGAGKMGLDGYARGLAASVSGTGVSVQIVRPGFVTTKMTAHLDKAPFSTTADAVAEVIVEGLSKKTTVIYAPSIVKFVFAILRHLPEVIWRRLPG
ncbi:MAG: SDR family NAD(P)-dependent oxidoreductase [Actinomycetes bacterium]|jgi:decaprenylphospho-beta-D-erythro-pentofuranosid-2-ulose 2-reductase